MCKITALRHQCGHTKLRYTSTCRGTYFSPNTKAPLCSAGPSLCVTVEDICQGCQYNQFRRGWEARIKEAQEKLLAVRQLDCGWDDGEVALKAAQKASSEVEEVLREYRSEQQTYWKSYIDTPWTCRRPASRKKRRSSPKSLGDSPLRHVVGLEDLPKHVASEDDDLPPLEPCTSDSTSDAGSDAEDATELPMSWSSAGYIWRDVDFSALAKGVSSQESGDLGDDGFDAMLPAY